jgi:hypothetical protein
MKKTTRFLGVAGTTALFAFGGWLGCTSDSSTNPNSVDGGGTDAPNGADQSVPVDGNGPGTDSGTDAPAPPISCETYCTAILANCTGANTQYALTAPHTAPAFSDKQQCLNMCGAMTPGTFAETADSVGCRQYHAGLAATDPVVHCPHAGPYGGDLCGDRCGAFCNLATKLCTSGNSNPQQWGSVADCKASCAKYPFQADAGQFDPADLDHLNCFEYHLREAYTAPDAAEPDDSGDTVAQGHCGDLIIDPDASPQGSCVN